MQTWALLRNSYHLVMSQKLFWVSTILSGLVVLIYASVGFNDEGYSIFFGLLSFSDEIRSAGTPGATGWYLGLFSFFIVNFWFTWIVVILGLVATAPIFGGFSEAGYIDLLLSKPIGRFRIFITKYVGGLLFVLFQVAAFCVGVFLCVGIRVDVWAWRVFLAVPLVVLFFSYLFAVSVLLTLLTRSVLASLLLTMVFWGVVFLLQYAELTVSALREFEAVQADHAEVAIPSPFGPADPNEDVETRRQRSLDNVATFDRVKNGIRLARSVFPKTWETTRLLSIWLSTDDINVAAAAEGVEKRNDQLDAAALQNLANERLVEERQQISTGQVIGTSLAFEAVILALACWLFVRRDF